jgi:deoxyribodipyrimidine photolyase-related protein
VDRLDWDWGEIVTIGIWVLGDQLGLDQAALTSVGCDRAHVILVESQEHLCAYPYHIQKLTLVWSAMRHFAVDLRSAGWSVEYVQDSDFEEPLLRWVVLRGITELRVMEPADRPFGRVIESLEPGLLALGCRLVRLPNNHFLWSAAEFGHWASGYKQLRLENFYRAGRRRFGVLMAGEEPIGGQWNFDKENRKPPKTGLNPPEALWFEPDEITRQVQAELAELVAIGAIETFGSGDRFGWAVTRDQALAVLDRFIETRLAGFGPYQDAMVTGQETMWHALISPYLNLGLLGPMEVIQAIESAYADRLDSGESLDLAGVEGVIRQVLGWREYMYGLYHWFPADYGASNWFDHQQPLPEFFWTGETELNCLRQSLIQIQQTGYGHHIQRLMILSNFALISGLNPQSVESWFHAVFIDAYDWVMQTNVLGMGLFADGGKLASKPYAASANYINKMSDYCRGCRYDPKARTGENACPFNYFYWDFMARHRSQLKAQGRINLILGQLDRMDPAELAQIQAQAEAWHESRA